MNPDDARAPRSARRVGAWMALIVIAAALGLLGRVFGRKGGAQA